jgi:hypothetical protein
VLTKKGERKDNGKVLPLFDAVCNNNEGMKGDERG